MTKVVQRFPGRGKDYTCMLMLASWCNDDGGSLYPSIAYLASAMRVSESQARRVLHSLLPVSAAAEASGDWFIRVIGNEKGGGSTRQYQLNVSRLDLLPKLLAFQLADDRRQTRH